MGQASFGSTRSRRSGESRNPVAGVTMVGNFTGSPLSPGRRVFESAMGQASSGFTRSRRSGESRNPVAGATMVGNFTGPRFSPGRRGFASGATGTCVRGDEDSSPGRRELASGATGFAFGQVRTWDDQPAAHRSVPHTIKLCAHVRED